MIKIISLFLVLLLLSCNINHEVLKNKQNSNVEEFQRVKANVQEGLKVIAEIHGTSPYRGELMIINNCGTIPQGDFLNKMETTFIEPDGTINLHEKGNITGTFLGTYELGDTIRQKFYYSQYAIRAMISKKPQNGYYKEIQNLFITEGCRYEIEIDFYIDLNVVAI